MASTGAIAGLGITEMGKIYGRTATDFAAEAIALALDDAGLAKPDVDGLLVNGNLSAEMNPNLQLTLGFEDLTLLNVMNAYGSTPATMLQYAFAAIDQGQANVVALRVRRCAAPAGHVGRRRLRAPARGCTGWAASSTPTASTAPTPATPWRPNGT